MTPTERHQAILALIAAELEQRRAELAICRSKIHIGGCISEGTVRNIFRGRDHRISSLVDMAHEMGLELEIRFSKRTA